MEFATSNTSDSPNLKHMHCRVGLVDASVKLLKEIGLVLLAAKCRKNYIELKTDNDAGDFQSLSQRVISLLKESLGGQDKASVK